jgi:hypothetical protein
MKECAVRVLARNSILFVTWSAQGTEYVGTAVNYTQINFNTFKNLDSYVYMWRLI